MYFTVKPSSRHASSVSMSNSSSSAVMYKIGVLWLNDSQPFLSDKYCRAIAVCSRNYAMIAVARASRSKHYYVVARLRRWRCLAKERNTEREVCVRRTHNGDAVWAHSRCGFTRAKPCCHGWLRAMRGWWSPELSRRPPIRSRTPPFRFSLMTSHAGRASTPHHIFRVSGQQGREVSIAPGSR
jgi:hypothetical protein